MRKNWQTLDLVGSTLERTEEFVSRAAEEAWRAGAARESESKGEEEEVASGKWWRISSLNVEDLVSPCLLLYAISFSLFFLY